MQLRTTALVGAGLTALVLAPRVHAGNPPRLGLEWEFDGELQVVGVKSFDATSAPAALAIGDPKTVSDQRVLCSGSGDASSAYPLVSMTYDIGDETGRTLEVVTAPIEHDDRKDWARAFKFIEGFFQAMTEVCEPSVVTIDGKLEHVCYASALQIAQRMNANDKTFDVQIGKKCDKDATLAPTGKEVGFFLERDADDTDRPTVDDIDFDEADPQVNLGLDLATFYRKPEAVVKLFDDDDTGPDKGIARRAYLQAQAALAKVDQPDVVKGFFTLYFYTLAAYTHFYEVQDGKAITEWTEQASTNYKNTFDLYPKSPLGAVYALVKDAVKGGDVAVSWASDKAAMLPRFCPADVDCTKHLRSFATSTTKVAGNPLAVGKTIAPVAIAREADALADVVVVFEVRSGDKILDPAHLVYDDHAKAGERIHFVDQAKLERRIGALAPSRKRKSNGPDRDGERLDE